MLTFVLASLQIGHTIEDRIRSIQNRKQAIVSASMSKGGAGEQTDAQKSTSPGPALLGAPLTDIGASSASTDLEMMFDD